MNSMLLVASLVHLNLVDLKKFLGFDKKNGGGVVVVVNYFRVQTSTTFSGSKWGRLSLYRRMVEALL